MPRFMLDTDTCSYIMKRSHPLVLKRLQAVHVDDVCMSVITKAELLYGVEVSPRRAHDASALAAFLPYVEVIELHATDRKGRTGTYALRLFPEVQLDRSLDLGDESPESEPVDGTPCWKTTNGDA